MFTIEDYMIKDLQLKGTDLLVFAFLSSQGVVEIPNEDLKNEVGVKSVTTVKNSLKCLEDRGLISITVNGSNKPNTIEVISSTPQTPEVKVNPKSLFRGEEKTRRTLLD